MAQQFYVTNIDDLKKFCPNLDVDNLLVQVDNEVGIRATNTATHQQYVMQDDTIIANDGQQQQQQHIVYQQQPAQAQQQQQQQHAPQQYIIQQTGDDHMQQQVLVQYQQQQQKQLQQPHTQQIFYANDQMLQQAQQQSQPTIVYRSVAASSPQQHQQLLNDTHVIVQDPQQQLIIQQSQPLQQNQTISSQQQQSSSHIILRQPVTQQRLLYTTTNQNRTVLYTQAATQQSPTANQPQNIHHISTSPQQHIQIQSTPQGTPLTTSTSRIVQNRSTATQQQQQHQQLSQNIVFHPVQTVQSLQQPQQTAQQHSHALTPLPNTRPVPRRLPAPRFSIPNDISSIRTLAPHPRVQNPQTVRATRPVAARAPRIRTTLARPAAPRPQARATIKTTTTQQTSQAAQMVPVSKVVTIANSSQFIQNRVIGQQRLLQQQQQMAKQEQTMLLNTTQQKFAIGIAKAQSAVPVSAGTLSNQNIAQPQTQSGLDIEESIQAIIVERHSEQRAQVSSPSSATTLTTYYSDPEDDKKNKKETTIPLTEYKKLSYKPATSQPQQRMVATPKPAVSQPALISRPSPQMQQQQPTTVPKLMQSTSMTSITQTPPTEVALSSIQQTSHNNYEIQTKHVIQNRGMQANGSNDLDRNSARMLVVMNSGEQRLITFTLPRESCTVQDLLEQVAVPFDQNTTIQCTESPGADIDFVVTVGFSSKEYPSELISRTAQTLQQNRQQDSPLGDKAKQLQAANESAKEAVKAVDVPKKLISGFYAVCKHCGVSGNDHAKCERCHTVFTEEPRRMPIAKAAGHQQLPRVDDDKKRFLPSEYLARGQQKALASANTAAARNRMPAMARAKGRGIRMRPVEVEPVILTLSSDDEEDSKGASTNSLENSSQNSATSAQVTPFSFEPVIPEEEPAEDENCTRENVADIANSTDKVYTSFACKQTRLGTYRFQSKQAITFTARGLQLYAPHCTTEKDVQLNILASEIVKVVTHFSKTLSVIYIYTLRKCGEYIRQELDMKPKSLGSETPYYNPGDRGEPYKRIVLELETMTEEAKAVIKSIYQKSVLEEISAADAHELLLRSASKDKLITSGSEMQVKLENNDIRQILIYPQGKGGISINTEDYMCLATEQYLNDVIIDFYLKWLHDRVLTVEQQAKTHIFSTFFYKRLTTMTTRQKHSDKDVKLTAAQKRHARVQNWTKNVSLFEKDFIVIPINEQSHWFLAIICFPSLMGPVTADTNEPVVPQQIAKRKKIEKKMPVQIGNTTITPVSKKEQESSVCIQDEDSERDEAEGDESDFASDDSASEGAATSQDRPIKQPVILIFDSLAGASRSRVVATLRDYLTCEYRAKIKENTNHTFNKLNMPGHCVKVPQQNNFTDCGLFLLQYVEHFFKEPIADYRIPIKQLVDWFETIVVTKKREDISNLLKDLIEDFNPKQPSLPDIALPTLNGKLVEQEESFTEDQTEFEEEDMDEETLDDEDELTDDFSSPEKSTLQPPNTPASVPKLGKKIVLKRSFQEISGINSPSPVQRKSSKME